MADLRLQAYVEVWICVLVCATIFILLVSKDIFGKWIHFHQILIEGKVLVLRLRLLGSH